MTDAIPILLTEHASALRQLARRLLADDHAAADAVQETWLRAVQAPPTGPRPAAWLETVLRNVVRHRHRAETRRAQREHAAARPEAVASAADATEWRQTLAALSQAIDTLPPAQQDVVFARYFEGRPPRAIARRRGVDVRTVYRDLERARVALRASLARRLGSGHRWRARVGLLLPAAWRHGWRGPIATGALLMASKKIIAVATAAGILSTALLLTPPSSPPTAVARGGEPPAAPTTLSGAAAATPATAERSPVTTADPVEALAPYSYELEMLAFDNGDLPAQRATLWVAPQGHALNHVRTDAHGRALLRWRGRKPTMELLWGSPADYSKGTRLRRTRLHAGQSHRVVVSIASPAAGSRVAVMGRLVSWSRVEIGGASTPIPELFQANDGTHWFETPRTPVTSGAEAVQMWQGITVSTASNFVLFDDAKAENRSAVIFGTATAADGTPAQAALVVASQSEDWTQRHVVRTGDDGTFELALPPGEYFLRAGGGDFGRATTHLAVDASARVPWNPTLARGTELRASLLSPDGAPLAEWFVEIEPDDGSATTVDVARTDADGWFAIPNVDLRPYRLRARPPKVAHMVWQRAAVMPGTEPTFAVDAAATAAGALEVEARDDHGVPFAGCEVRVWNSALDEATRVAHTGEDGRTVLEGLPQATYGVEIGGAGTPWRTLPPVQVFAGGQSPVSAIDLPRPALPRLLGTAPDSSVPLTRMHPLVLSRAGLCVPDVGLALPVGTYRLGPRPGSSEVEMISGSQDVPPPTR